MSNIPANTPFTGAIPYHLATRACRAQAQQHAQELLLKHFPLLTPEHCSRIFTEYRPLLWVNENRKLVTVAERALPGLLDSAAHCEESLYNLPTQSEAHYLARQLAYYCSLAGKLVAEDPMLTLPDSIVSMREVFHRLCVGNAVAERLSEPFEQSAGLGA